MDKFLLFFKNWCICMCFEICVEYYSSHLHVCLKYVCNVILHISMCVWSLCAMLFSTFNQCVWNMRGMLFHTFRGHKAFRQDFLDFKIWRRWKSINVTSQKWGNIHLYLGVFFPTPPIFIPHFYDVRIFLSDFLRLQIFC